MNIPDKSFDIWKAKMRIQNNKDYFGYVSGWLECLDKCALLIAERDMVLAADLFKHFGVTAGTKPIDEDEAE
jgi:hypothetical protein